jgi:outer membrane protein assembly factor BamB
MWFLPMLPVISAPWMRCPAVSAEVSLKRDLSTGVAVAGDTVIVGTLDGKLLAERSSGKVLWEQSLTSVTGSTASGCRHGGGPQQ